MMSAVMNATKVVFFYITILVFCSTLAAETIKISGSSLIPKSGNQESVNEQYGCFFNVNTTGLDLPAGAIVTNLNAFTLNTSKDSRNVKVVLYKHYANSFGEMVVNQTFDVNPGYETTIISLESGGFDPVNEFSSVSVYTHDTVAICGISVEYVIDVIFINSFD